MTGIILKNKLAREKMRNAGQLLASIMDGKTLNAGASAGTQTVRNPINLARAVMACRLVRFERPTKIASGVVCITSPPSRVA